MTAVFCHYQFSIVRQVEVALLEGVPAGSAVELPLYDHDRKVSEAPSIPYLLLDPGDIKKLRFHWSHHDRIGMNHFLVGRIHQY